MFIKSLLFLSVLFLNPASAVDIREIDCSAKGQADGSLLVKCAHWASSSSSSEAQSSFSTGSSTSSVALSSSSARSQATIVNGIRLPDNCENRHDCAGIDLAGIPPFSQGRDGKFARQTDHTINFDSDIGAFRTICQPSHMAYDDPLVFPGQFGAAHMHLFFGNTDINAMTTLEDVADKGDSTCRGGILNRSAYWAPSLIDTSTGKVLIPYESIFYYKEGYNGLSGTGFPPLPLHLGMIGKRYDWDCDARPGNDQARFIPDCPVGKRVMMSVKFPQCWNGRDFWLADHSHMVYTTRGRCPSTHPYHIPEITVNLRYRVEYEGQVKNMRLSSDGPGTAPGSTAHADWINGWDVKTSNTWLTNCLNAIADCHANLLGDGTVLY